MENAKATAAAVALAPGTTLPGFVCFWGFRGAVCIGANPTSERDLNVHSIVMAVQAE